MTRRREFLRRASALGAGGLAARMLPLSALGLSGAAQAQSADYKALVCVFLYGGVDGNNLVVPMDTAGYAQYAGVRTAASGVNLAQSALLPIQPSNTATPYGLHPELTEIHPLFAQRRLAILANVGPLNEPTTRGNYLAKRPENLFSHSDQQNQWQSSVSSGPSRTGWGGRIADQFVASNGTFPVITSIAGANLFIAGNVSSPLALPATGGITLQGFNGNATSNARLAAMQAILASDAGNTYVKAAADISSRAISLSTVVNPILSSTTSATQPFFAGQTSSIAQQLSQVAKLVEGRSQTGARRQVFFVSLGGFDTHSDELNVLANLLGQLSPALRAFHDAMAQIGMAESVTAFTLSDFGRTFQPASGAGTDHAWGNHHFIMGGAVRGGQMYGRYPTLARSGPDDADTSGRWIPTTAVEQYGATLARWFGVSDAQMAAVFPNLSRFAASDLGFLA
ncbi:MAG TPA: DUF1501 domain-containing protein [Usitatibacter sp.]|nr:DUF1501 domain-containing protein [Usitatibacter sp.]